MINPKYFFNLLLENDINFFAGVPDSLLKSICAYISDNVPNNNNIIAANEGGAIAIGAGYHFATGKIPLIYMQNSGLGNAINPLLSLVDNKVYGIPMLLMIGWRGEPGVKDEPQHIKQGEVTIQLLEAIGIPYKILNGDNANTEKIVKESIVYVKKYNGPFAYVIQKDCFEPYNLQKKIETNFEMKREDAIKIIVDSLNIDDIVVSTTGKTSRELFEYREALGHSHKNDILTVGSMGHASQIALGIAINKPNKNVYCFDGDGSLLMHTGSLGIIGDLKPENFKHIIFNNGAHDSVGGQPTIGYDVNFKKLAQSFNYKNAYSVKTISELKKQTIELKSSEGPSLLEIKVNKGARKDLGRPTKTPLENKLVFMDKS